MSIFDSLEKIMYPEGVTQEVTISDEAIEEGLKDLLFANKDSNIITEAKKAAPKKTDPKAKIRNKPEPIFDDKSSKVTDKKDHFPIDTIGRARNALARAGAFTKAPAWYKGSLEQFKKSVKSAVKKAYPSIEVTKD